MPVDATVLDAVDIPVIGAGNLVTGADIAHVLDMGASGVQMGTRFAATVECSAADAFKQCYLDATEDDVVLIKQRHAQLVGCGSPLTRHHMEVRGVGIINIKDMFGVASVRDEKRIELVMELVRWEESEAADRVGLDDQTYSILDVPVPMLRIPVSPGRNVSSLVEVAARNRLLQVRGHHAAREFQERLDQALAEARQRRFRGDVE